MSVREQKRPSQTGATLIEVPVVVTIIGLFGLFAAIAGPKDAYS